MLGVGWFSCMLLFSGSLRCVAGLTVVCGLVVLLPGLCCVALVVWCVGGFGWLIVGSFFVVRYRFDVLVVLGLIPAGDFVCWCGLAFCMLLLSGFGLYLGLGGFGLGCFAILGFWAVCWDFWFPGILIPGGVGII